MNAKRLQHILTCFPQQRILVVGDVMLDRFLWGKVSRISPEAPVPVVEINRESLFPGGGANVARNLRALGASVSILGVLGDDDTGENLRDLLDQQGVDTDGLVIDPNRPTTLKTRIVAHGQQVVRFDRETCADLPPQIERRVLEHFESRLGNVSAVIFEDYAKGLLSQKLLNAMQRLAHNARKITAADPNSRSRIRYSGLTAVTPNRSEAFAAADLPHVEPVEDVLRDEALLRVGQALLRTWKPRNLLVTLGEHGMFLFRPGKRPHYIPTVAQEVFDVSGAGDTVIATLVLALAAKADAVDAAEISNHAAGVVVGKVGTATCSPKELIASFLQNRR
ncbi:MAG: D-glycero-beta-D-manno-heptose-7-phosphate kinase [Verrucomicrobiia bacterium]|jgi:D-beta-D-heptose 7-phosphate kinase/D-beta-D-heptose 1-phosphate adenosyltransferase